MHKIQKHIEIIRSATKGLSSLSLVSAEAIQQVLSQTYSKVGISTINDLADLKKLAKSKPDLVFMGMEFVPSVEPRDIVNGKKIWVSTYLEDRGIKHTGSDRNAAELERYKALAKQRVLDANLKTSPYVVVRNGQIPSKDTLNLRYPLFVKPACLGAGQGIDNDSIVQNYEDLELKVKALNGLYSANVLVEQYLPGREFSVALLINEISGELMAMPIELVAAANDKGERFLGSEAKSSNEEVVLPLTDTLLRTKITDLAKGVFVALGARDYGRIDMRLDVNGEPHFLEANLIPSLIKDYGSFPKACVLNRGLAYEDMILSIVNLGMSRVIVADEQVFESTFEPVLSPA